MEQRLLALDQASKTTGWAIFINGKLEKYGKFDFTDKNVIIRIRKLRETVTQFIEDNEINEVVLEDIQMQGGAVTTYKMLAYVLGTLELLCTDQGIKYTIVGSSSWKSTCGVKGANRPAQKLDAQRFVTNMFEITTNQDAIDAICIGYSMVHGKKSAW